MPTRVVRKKRVRSGYKDTTRFCCSTFVHTETLMSVPWREVNMKASGNSTAIKQNTQHSHCETLQGAGASIKLYCPWVT